MKRNTADGVCSEGVLLMAHMTKKLAVVAIKLEMKFNTAAAMIEAILTFSPGKIPRNVIGQLIKGVVLKLPDEFIASLKIQWKKTYIKLRGIRIKLQIVSTTYFEFKFETLLC